MKPAASAKERTALLLKHPDVSVWVKDRSAGTAATQLDHLRVFLERTGLEPGSLILLAKRDERRLKNTVLDFIRERQEAGLKAKYVGNIWWSVRSFLRSVNAAPEWNPTVKETEADEEGPSRGVPTHEQVRQIASATKSARDRMVVLVLASSSVRIGVFGTQNGHADGLRIKHLVDLRLRPEPRFEKAPPMLRVPAHLAKANVAYYTGLTGEAGDAVVAYLKERIHRGEKLTLDSPIAVPDARGTRESRRSKDGYEIVMRKSLGSRVQAAMDAVAPKGTRWTPHSLRAFASTALEAAEARGAISRTRRFYFTAHALGSVDSGYNLSRPLIAEKVEELRADWSRALPFLSLDQGNRKQLDTKAELLGSLLKAIEEATGERARGPITAESLKAILRDAMGASSLVPASPSDRGRVQIAVAPPAHAAEQRSVEAELVQSYLDAGWRFQSALNSRLAIVEWTRPVPVSAL